MCGIVIVALAAGCGHKVTPTQEFTDRASVPLCCKSDPTATCCGLDGVAFIGGIKLNWNSEDSVFVFIDGWNMYRASGDAVPLDSDYVRINGFIITEREFIDSDIANEVWYWSRLASVTPAGIESNLTPPAAIRADFTPPAPPTGLRVALLDSTRVGLEWDPSPEPDWSHYLVARDPQFPPTVFTRVEIEDFLDATVARGMTYRYWVRAVDIGINQSAPSDTVDVVIP
jgi:hypothetical protein